MSNGENQRTRAIELFRYLRAVAELRLRQTLDVADWEQVIWLDDLSAPQNCLTRLDHHDLDDWIRVERPAAPPAPPPLPPLLRGWVDPEQIEDWRGAPELRREPHREFIVEDAGQYRAKDYRERVENDPQVLNAWTAYEDQWLDWAEKREAVEPAHEIYRKFFVAQNRVVQLGEQYEVVVAVGLLNWRLPGRTIRRHLVATPASLTYDADSGLISVAPSGMGNQPIRLEDEMVPAGSHPSSSVSIEIRAALDAADEPFDESVTAALRQWVLAADESGVFSPALQPGDQAAATPEVRFAPAVILRRRLQGSLRQTYDEIISRLTEGADVPPTVRSLVDDTADTRHDDRVDGDARAVQFETSTKPFFPLPTNPQQHRIVEELGRRRGVVVQGPPGTGKSHTIANLISHCLATGKRVLVTSHTERALRVLKEKLPEDISDLTVSVLGAGREGAADLQRSANALLGRRSDPGWSVDSLDTKINQLTSRLQEVEASHEQCRENLARLRAAASTSHQLPSGYSGQIGDIAMLLSKEKEAHGWLPDRVSGPMPIRHEELVELRALREQVRGIEPNLASHHLPPPDSLPSAEAIDAARQARENAERRLNSLDGDTATAERLRHSPIDLTHLAELLRDYDDADRAARRRSEPWLDDALIDWDAGRTNRWQDLRLRTNTYLEHSFGHPYDSVEPTSVDPGQMLLRKEQTRELVAALESGGRLTALFGRPSRVAKRNSMAFEIADRLELPLRDLQSAEHLLALLEELHALEELARQWGQHFEPTQGTLAQVRARLHDHRETLSHLSAVADARSHVSSVAEHVLRDPVDTALDVAHLRGALQVAEALTTKDRAEKEHQELIQTLVSAGHADAHPMFRRLFDAARDQQIEQYRESRAELERLFRHRRQLERFHILRDSLRAAAPLFTTAAVEGATDLPGADALDQAWRWSWAIGEIERLRDRSESELIAQLHGDDREIANYTAALTSMRAWRNTLAGMTDDQATELKAYQQAILRLGKGLGKQAATHRRDAQRHLANCQTAVRAWIMPTYRVAETLRAEPESFDLVIVDEASQSGVDALFLFWLGKQMVIVGDDNQISPSNIGIRAEDVTALQRKHLDSLGLRDLLGVGESLFNQAKVRYSGEVWLTEHFRCMPEIIEFSNRLLYAPQLRPLEPLRQFGNNRLRPLERRHVPHGQREGPAGRVINRAEARELIDVLIECHNDPQYDGLTFGVIGLLGGQAHYIEARLLDNLPSEVWQDRQLRCGDAYDFQGDERDVIFLSMVTSLEPPQNHIPKLGNRSDEQRYNVAASRARDQMWLFHSVTLEQLNPECVRYKLLNHFLAPPALDVTPFEEAVDRDIAHPTFDSLFEQRVFLDIREHGYVVRPQVEAYGRRIDIVVAGSQGRLAVECDGAAWHGHEQYAADLARQRDLERAGWTFFRVRDTDYYLNPAEALEPLWELLASLNIHPPGMGGDAARAQASPPPHGVQPSPTALMPKPIEPRTEDNTAPGARPHLSSVTQEASEEEQRGEPAKARHSGEDQQPPPAGARPAPSTGRRGSPVERLGRLFEAPESPQDRRVKPQHSADAQPEPYLAWEARPVSPLLQLDQRQLAELLAEIIEIEGPVVAERVYQLANRAAGSTRLGGNIRSALDGAVTSAIRRGQVFRTDPLGSGDLLATLRPPRQPAVRLRALGPRGSLRHVPPQELSRVLHSPSLREHSTEERYRAVLERYGLKRLTEGTRDLLIRCEQLPDPPTKE